MPNLDTLLSFPASSRAGPSSAAERTPIPPRSSQILVTDTIDAPALFVLIHFLRASHAANKQQSSASSSAAPDTKGKARVYIKVIWIGCGSDGSVHLKNVARKSAVHLDQEMRDGSFSFIDANADILASLGEDDVANAVASMQVREDGSQAERLLRKLYRKVAQDLEDDSKSQHEDADWTSRALIVVDDLNALAWASDPTDSFGQPVDVSRLLTDWLGALTSLAAKNQASIITLMHADATSKSKNGASDPLDESLLNTLLQKADVWVEVKELASGRARDCDGEITVHPLVRPSLARALPASHRQALGAAPRVLPPLHAFAIDTPCPSRTKAVLYRIAPDGQSAALGGASVGSNIGRVQIWARGTGRGFL